MHRAQTTFNAIIYFNMPSNGKDFDDDVVISCDLVG